MYVNLYIYMIPKGFISIYILKKKGKEKGKRKTGHVDSCMLAIFRN